MDVAISDVLEIKWELTVDAYSKSASTFPLYSAFIVTGGRMAIGNEQQMVSRPFAASCRPASDTHDLNFVQSSTQRSCEIGQSKTLMVPLR